MSDVSSLWSEKHIIIYYENRTLGTLKTIKKKKYNRLKSNSRYILTLIKVIQQASILTAKEFVMTNPGKNSKNSCLLINVSTFFMT